MIVNFAIRCEERNDTRAFAIVKTALVKNGLIIDYTRKPTCRRNGGLWQYEIPVEEYLDL